MLQRSIHCCCSFRPHRPRNPPSYIKSPLVERNHLPLSFLRRHKERVVGEFVVGHTTKDGLKPVLENAKAGKLSVFPLGFDFLESCVTPRSGAGNVTEACRSPGRCRTAVWFFCATSSGGEALISQGWTYWWAIEMGYRAVVTGSWVPSR